MALNIICILQIPFIYWEFGGFLRLKSSPKYQIYAHCVTEILKIPVKRKRSDNIDVNPISLFREYSRAESSFHEQHH